MSLAKTIISGTVGSDPEKRYTPNQNVAVTTFNLEVPPAQRSFGNPPPGGDQPYVIKVTCWRQLADVVADQIHRGDSIVVDGKLTVPSYQTADGTNRKVFEIEAASIDKLPAGAQPLMVSAASAQGSGVAPSGGGYTSGPAQYSGSQPSGGYASQPSAVTPSGPSPAPSGFSSEDLLTEDDIPF